MRRRIGELESALGVEGAELAKQQEAGTLPVERDRLELALMVQAYDSERRLLVSQGATFRDPGGDVGRSGRGHGPAGLRPEVVPTRVEVPSLVAVRPTNIRGEVAYLPLPC